jgi:cytochrome P450
MTVDNVMMFDPLSPEFRENPYPYYQMLRTGAPIFYLDSWNMWFCTRHEDVSSLLRDNRLGHEILRHATEEEAQLNSFDNLPEHHQKRARMQGRWMIFRDPPDHNRLRGLVHKAFTPRMVRKMQTHIAEISEALLDEAEGRDEFDLINEFAVPLPVTVIAEMLGVPLEDRDQFKGWSDDLAGTLDLVGDNPDLWERAAIASSEFDLYFRALADQRRQDPQDDLLTALVEAEEDGETLTEDELVATCILILIAGHETTVNLIGNGTFALMNNRDQLDLLQQTPSLMPNAVEEFLRYDSPVQMTRRWVLEDMEYAGNHFKKGQQVALMLAAANRDPALFPQPDNLDITRENASKHMSFGNGIHFCLGAPLARLEATVAFDILLKRFPNLALAPDAEIEHHRRYILRGLKALKLTTG